MTFSKLAMISGSFLGLVGVIAGALGTHALEGMLNTEQLQSYETAVRYQMYHALLLIFLGVISSTPAHKFIRISILGLITGIILFSGSIYLLVLTDVKVGIITPIGGVFLILGWISFLLWSIRYKPDPNK